MRFTWKLVRVFAAILVFYLFLLLASRQSNSFAARTGHPIFGPRPGAAPLLIAHQGGNLERPDATRASFNHGRDTGADVLELDAHSSSDGSLAVLHDNRVDRTTNGSGRVAEMTMNEIGQLDAGYWWPYHANDDVEKERIPQGQDFPWRGKGLSILSFEQVLDFYPDTALNVELKEPGKLGARLLATMLNLAGRTSDILVVSEHMDAIKAFREHSPDTATAASKAELTRFFILSKVGLEGLAGLKADALQVPLKKGKLRIVTPAFIRAAHRHGLSVHVWTINEPAEMDRLIKMGVDGIITDRPSLLAEKLQSIR